jgi:hypothetical protein
MTPEQACRYEIKGRRLFSRAEKKHLPSMQLLLTLLDIAESEQIPIFYGAVHREGYKRVFTNDPSETGPYALAFYECADAIDRYTHREIPKEKILWIADRSKAEARLKEGLLGFREMRLMGWDEILKGTGLEGIRLPSLHEPHVAHITDTIYFGDSKESRALQLADVYSSTITRALNGDALGTEFYPLIRNSVERPRRPLFGPRNVLDLWDRLLYG